MHKLILTFLLLFLGVSLLASIMDGGGGIVSTTLAENITANTTYIPTDGTTLFANKDIILIGSEKILYTSKIKEAEEHYYNPRYQGLIDIGVVPHYLTHDVMESMFRVVTQYKENIRKDVIFRGVKW